MAVLFLLWLVIQGPADTGGVGLCSWLLPNDPLLWFIGLSRILPPSSPLESLELVIIGFDPPPSHEGVAASLELLELLELETLDSRSQASLKML